MSDITPNLSLPYIIAAQAQKHVTHNEALRTLDALLHLAVEDKDLSAPPPAPANGTAYIVAAGASGTWTGQSTYIAAFQDGAWQFYVPKEGWIAWVADEDKPYVFNGSAWAVLSNGAPGSINPAPLVGVNATADATNKLSVSAPASLFNHEGADHRQKINKAAIGDTASTIYQTGLSGRAEIGLTGDDNLHFKVSSDGNNFYDALVLVGATGTPRFPAFLNANLPPASTAGAGSLVFISDAPGGASLAVSDGTEWKLLNGSGPSGPAIPLLIFAGESNAGGLALNTNASGAELAPRSVVKILNNTSLAFQDLDVGTNNIIGHQNVYGGQEANHHGLEIGIANTVDAGRWADNPASIYLVKTGQGGSTIAQWDTGNASGYWSAFLARINAAKSALVNANVNYAPIVFYSQGINDAVLGSPTPVATWKAATIAHLAKIRGELGGTTPIYLTKFAVPPFAAGDNLYNTAMDEIAAADAYTAVLDTSGLGMVDTHHLNYSGFLSLSERLLDAINGASGTLAAPVLSPAAGSYGSTQSVIITGPSGAVIRYTTDGSEPTSHSALYTGPISVSVTTTVKAIAMRNGYKNSSIAAAAYTISTPTAKWSASDAAAAGWTLSNGDRTAVRSSSGAWKSLRADTSRASGKRYVEYKCQANSTNQFSMFGLANGVFSPTIRLGDAASSVGAASAFTLGNGFTIALPARAKSPQLTGDVMAIAVDLDAGKVWLANNNVWQQSGNPAAGTSPFATFTPGAVGALFPAIASYDPGAALLLLQAASSEQTYAPPAGFAAWV